MAKSPKRSRIKMLGKVMGSMLGARLAERSGQSGLLGGVAGLAASWVVRRSPIGALLVGGAWLGHKLYERNKEREQRGLDKAAANARPARVVAGPRKGAKVKAKPVKSTGNAPTAPDVPPAS